MPSSEVLNKFKHGDLHSGSKHGAKVTSRAQAIAIMLSEKRKEEAHGGHYPEAHKSAHHHPKKPKTRLAHMR